MNYKSVYANIPNLEITWSLSFHRYSQQTPQGSPSRARRGVPSVSSTSDLHALHAEGIDTEFEVMAQSRHSWGCGYIWKSVVSQPWPKTTYQFLFYHGTTKLTLNLEILSSQTASQLCKFKGQSHCKHWVTWPDCFATPSNHYDVTAGLVSQNYLYTLSALLLKFQWGITIYFFNEIKCHPVERIPFLMVFASRMWRKK